MFRINVLDRKTLDVLDYSELIEVELNFDLLLPKVSLVTSSKILNVNEGDLAWIVDSKTNKQVYFGIIAKAQILNNIQNLSLKQFNNYFELSLPIQDFDGKLGDFVSELITEFYINSIDPKIQVDYFNVIDNTDINFIIDISESGENRFEQKTLEKILYNLFKGYNFHINHN